MPVLHTEHIIPKKHSGSDDIDNLAVECIDCNLRKGSNLINLPLRTRGYAVRDVRYERRCYTRDRPSRSTGYTLRCPWIRRQVPSHQMIART